MPSATVVREPEVWAEIVATTGQSKKEILAILTDPAASFGREWNAIQNYDKIPASERPKTIDSGSDPIEFPFQATKAVDWAGVLNTCFEYSFGSGSMTIFDTSDYWAIFVKRVVDSECARHPLEQCTSIHKFALECALIDELRIDPRIPHQSVPEVPLPILRPPEEEFTMRALRNVDEADLSLWTPEWATMWPEACTDTEFNCDPGDELCLSRATVLRGLMSTQRYLMRNFATGGAD
ncbi:hypothetical protein M8818_006736 [Zalaria obscura]|uniref:Uncharacterized protein n=1 Tax=Zalaria obscura TaxID=2024903 RepID=A0ACC3S4R8_9PEZI